MYEPTSAAYHDAMTDAALLVAGERGPSGLSVRGIAERMRITPQAVLARYRTADETMRIVLVTAVERWERWLWARSSEAIRECRGGAGAEEAAVQAVLALVPSDAEDLEDVRAWLALRCRARHRCQEDVREAVRESLWGRLNDAATAEQEVVEHYLPEVLGRRPRPVEVEAVAGLAGGLRDLVVDRVTTPAAARDALRCVVTALRDRDAVAA